MAASYIDDHRDNCAWWGGLPMPAPTRFFLKSDKRWSNCIVRHHLELNTTKTRQAEIITG